MPGQDDRERGYWRDVGTIDSYYTANMDLIAPLPAFNLYNDEWPVYTYHGADPPAKVSRGPGWEPAYVDGCLLCQGSIVSGAHVERSIVAPGCYVSNDAHVTDSILFPGVRVGVGARLHRCIIDKNVAGARTGTASATSPTRTASCSPSATAASPSSRRTASSSVPTIPSTTAAPARSRCTESMRSGVRCRQGGDDRGERVDLVGADDDVAEAELLAAAQRASR